MSKLVTQPSFRAALVKHTRNGRHLKTLEIRDKCMVLRHGLASWGSDTKNVCIGS